MWAAADVQAEISTDPGTRLRATTIGPQVDFAAFVAPPQTLDEGVVPLGPVATIHADLDLMGGQHLYEVGRGELTAQVRVVDPGLAVLRLRLSFHAEGSLQRGRHPPDQDPPGDPVEGSAG